MADTDVSVKEIKINTPLEIVIRLVTKEDGPMRAVWNLDPPPHNTEVIRSGGIPSNRYVPCYVSDADRAPGTRDPVDVVRYSEGLGHYISIRGIGWEYATRIPEDKLWVPAAKDVK